MFNQNDRRWLLPIIFITVATLAIYAAFVISDFHNGHKTDTYQVTVDRQSDIPSPVADTPVADSTPTGGEISNNNGTTSDTDIPSTGDTPRSDSNILHATDVPEGSYIGNKNSEKYHRFDCEYGAKVQDNNLIVFDSLEDAINSGYKPCGACHPDK